MAAFFGITIKADQPPPGLAKLMPLNAQTARIENGFVHLPAEAEWLDLYLHELATFPAGKHDDQVDSTSQALHWIKASIKPVPNFILYMDQQLRERGIEPRKFPPSWR